MSFINPTLKCAVENFIWNDEDDLPISQADFSRVVHEIFNKITETSNHGLGKNLSLVEASYLIAQKEDLNLTLSNIQQATLKDKKVLNQVFSMISSDFPQVQPNDLKKITLLLGVTRIHKVTSAQIFPTGQRVPNIQNMENKQNNLILEIDRQNKKIEQILNHPSKKIV